MNLDYIIRPQKYVRQELFGNKNTEYYLLKHITKNIKANNEQNILKLNTTKVLLNK